MSSCQNETRAGTRCNSRRITRPILSRPSMGRLFIAAIAAFLFLFPLCDTAHSQKRHVAHAIRHSRSRATKHPSKRSKRVSGRRAKTIEGVLFEREDGTAIRANNDDEVFNPASAVKLLTTLMALTRLGAQYQFDDTMPTVKGHERFVPVVKRMLCHSNNFMAEHLGAMLGGPSALRSFLIQNIAIPADDVHLASTSGLGVNRVSPLAMMLALRALKAELKKQNLDFQDIMPVAGMDEGTLLHRFTGAYEGRVVAKTGTLVHTDAGASALVGELHTAQEEHVYFVIFEMHGNVGTFRARQDALVKEIGLSLGGPAARPIIQQPLLPPHLSPGCQPAEDEPLTLKPLLTPCLRPTV